MKILAIGDVVGSSGCEFLRSRLPEIKKTEGIDFVIANGENSAEGNGITPVSADHMLTSGVDVITTGNHVYRRKEVYNLLDESPIIIRPMNFPDGNPGKGYTIVDTGRANICVVNLIGTVFMDSYASPFKAMDELLATLDKETIVMVDFHAEATSEKRALGFYLDGRVAGFFGTHTHVMTADECILPKGTGYISDLGMTGPIYSVLGVEPELAIKKCVNKMPVKFVNASGPCSLSGVVFDINTKTGRTNFIKRLQIK